MDEHIFCCKFFSKMFRKNLPTILRLLCKILLLVFLLLLIYFFKQSFPNSAPTVRGFFCDDPSLQYPYQESTVTHTMLLILGLYMPLALITIIELNRYFITKCKHKSSSSRKLSNRTEVKQLLFQLYHGIGSFLVGYVCERLFKTVGKFTIGRLRPHFFAVCQPQMPDGSTCADAINRGRYITDYTCLGINATATMLRSLHVSFPSGHSSMIFYGMVFLALYLQRSLAGRIGRVFRPALQLLCLLVAWFVALSRIMDYKHHWSDVLAGSILGAAIAVFIFASRFWSTDNKRMECGVVTEHNLEGGGGGVVTMSKPNAVLSEVINEKSNGVRCDVSSVVIDERPVIGRAEK